MYTHHKFDHAFPEGTEPRIVYWVCSTPRSGSSLLCELLCNTGLAGAPTEYFDREQMEGFARAWSCDGFESYLRALLAKKTSPNGVFGAKIHWGQKLDLFTDRALDDALPDAQFIWITRRDRVKQAVSWERANQTGQWASDHVASNRRPVFDYDRIASALEEIERGDEAWANLFSEQGITPHRVVYEDLIRNRESVIRGVLAALGIDLPSGFQIPEPTLRRQADWRSRLWAWRFRRRKCSIEPSG
ncbi:MAG: Stf0 family sulfotransferase [Planctomycetota bacterium]